MEIKFKDPYIKPNIIKPNPYCDMSLAPKRASNPRLWYAVAWRNAINLYGFITGLPKHLIGVFFSDEIFELKKEIEKLKQDAADKDFRLNICAPLLKKRERRIIELEDKLETANRSNGQYIRLLNERGLNGGNRG